MRHSAHQKLLAENANGGVSAGKILLYILAMLFIGMVVLNFLSSFGIGGCVGILEVTGEIATSSGYGYVSSSELIDLLKTAEERPNIHSLVLVVNSPGGSAVASNEIYTYLKQMRKPVVVYMSDMAASGGYYISLGGDYIYANPSTVTGSIGARMGSIFDISRLLNDSGINTTIVKSGDMKDIGDMYRPVTEEERAVLQSMIDEIASDFLNITIREREGSERFSSYSIQAISDARILTGKQAYGLGLVDALGTKQDAIDAAAAMAGMDPDPDACSLEFTKDFFSSMFSEMGRGIGETLANKISLNNFKIE